MIDFSEQRDIEQYFRTYTISHFAVSQDESKLVFNSNLDGKMNLWAMDLPHTYPFQISFEDQASDFVKFDPNGRYILTGFDNDGDENYQIYALPPEGGQPEPVITGEKQEKYYYAHLSQDGERLYYVTSEDNPNFLNLRKRNLETGEDELLRSGQDAANFIASVSPQEDSFVFVNAFSNTYQQAYVHINGDEFSLTPDPTKVHTVSDAVYTSNDIVYFLTNYENDFSYLATFHLKDKTFNKVLTLPNEDMKELVYHQASNCLYLVTEKGVEDRLYEFRIDNQEYKKLSQPTAVIESLHVADSGNMYVLGRSATKPHNLFQCQANSTVWTPLTENRVLGVPEEDLVDPDVVTYQLFDGMSIEALFFKAKADVANGYTIFWPHGGPQAAERKSFRALFQVILAKGYHIFAPN